MKRTREGRNVPLSVECRHRSSTSSFQRSSPGLPSRTAQNGKLPRQRRTEGKSTEARRSSVVFPTPWLRYGAAMRCTGPASAAAAPGATALANPLREEAAGEDLVMTTFRLTIASWGSRSRHASRCRNRLRQPGRRHERHQTARRGREGFLKHSQRRVVGYVHPVEADEPSCGSLGPRAAISALAADSTAEAWSPLPLIQLVNTWPQLAAATPVPRSPMPADDPRR